MTTNANRAAQGYGLTVHHGLGYKLRPFEQSDLNDLLGILSRSSEATWERISGTPEYARRLLSFRLHSYSSHGFGVLAVEDGSGGLVGQAGFQVFGHALSEVEVVIFLDSSTVGRGLGSLIVGDLLDAARAAGIDPVYAAIRLDNLGAQRFFRRFGFRLIREDTHFGQPCGVWVRSVVDPPTTRRVST